jgi:hypothetical protein
MKNYKLLLIATAFLMNAGCGKFQGNSSDTAIVPVDPSATTCRACTDPTALPGAPTGTGVGTDPTVTGFPSGSTAAFTADGGALAQMFYNSVPNNPTNVRINLNTGRRGQEIIISYEEGGRTVEAALGSVHPYNAAVSSTRYNGWTNDGNTQVWKGVYQDGYGAVIVVIDGQIGTGDGNSNLLSGSVWFQNFPSTVYPNAPYGAQQGDLKTCWEIVRGPYDCRSFLVGNNMVMNSSLFPTTHGGNAVNPYQKLGNFFGLSRSAAGL